MALMFQRLAHNYTKNGYYPTDVETMQRVINAIGPCESGPMRILDPCCGEGVALAELKYAMGDDRSIAYGIEYNEERAWHAKKLLDHCIHSDIHDCLMVARSFGCLLLNPPYGDLVVDRMGIRDKADRLEKQFYRMTNGLLQIGGVMILIIPHYSLDKDLSTMIAIHFTNVKAYAAAEERFKQVVVMGVKRKAGEVQAAIRNLLAAIGSGDYQPEVIPEVWSEEHYLIPSTQKEPKFYAVRLDRRQLLEVVDKSRTLWDQMGLVFHYEQSKPRRPLRRLSQWHLALSLAAGHVSGCVKSRDGRLFVIKGDTFKGKHVSEELEYNAKGELISTTRTHTDKFMPTIRALNFTPDSPSYGMCLTIK